MRELDLYGIKFYHNRLPEAPAPLPDWLLGEQTKGVRAFHCTLPQYAPTPLLNWRSLAAAGGVAGLWLKNEAERFGLKAFKALGSSYAIAAICCAALGLDLAEVGFGGLLSPAVQGELKRRKVGFVTATDGNHGRGVAWTARQLGCPARVFMPAGTEAERVQAIAELGAQVSVTGVSYDETVALTAAWAREQGGFLVQDTAFAGYQRVPKLIIQGYATMAAEIVEQIPQPPTHIFLQAGVGAMAGGMLAYLQQAWPEARFIIVEPAGVACCKLAAQRGEDSASIAGVGQTIMAGLNCGTPCPLVMPLLRERAEFFVACPDFVAAQGMRLAPKPVGSDQAFIAGESGAVSLGLISLLLGAKMTAARQMLGLGENSALLAINTEGAMAPRVWRQAVQEGRWPLPDMLAPA